MNKRKLNILLFLFFLITGIVYSICGQMRMKRIGIETFKVFNESEINGVLETSYVKYKGAAFKIKGDSIEYIFDPIRDESLNISKSFLSVAKEGDSIIKSPFSDTLILVNKRERLKYTFTKIYK